MGYFQQHGIPDTMTTAVIDGAKAIDIDHQNAAIRHLISGDHKNLAGCIKYLAPPQHPGQLVPRL